MKATVLSCRPPVAVVGVAAAIRSKSVASTQQKETLTTETEREQTHRTTHTQVVSVCEQTARRIETEAEPQCQQVP